MQFDQSAGEDRDAFDGPVDSEDENIELIAVGK